MRWGRSVVHAHYPNFVFGFYRIVAADEQPKGAAQNKSKYTSKQGLLMQIALEERILANNEQANQDKDNWQTPPFGVRTLKQ